MKKSSLRTTWSKAQAKQLQALMKARTPDGMASTEVAKDHLQEIIKDTEELLTEWDVVIPETLADGWIALEHRTFPRGAPAMYTELTVDELAGQLPDVLRDPGLAALHAFQAFKVAEACRAQGKLELAIQSLALGAFFLGQACAIAAAWETSVSGTAKANSRHKSDRDRKAAGRKLWDSKNWKVNADGIRAIQRQFHVTYKTAEKWVLEWKRGPR